MSYFCNIRPSQWRQLLISGVVACVSFGEHSVATFMVAVVLKRLKYQARLEERSIQAAGQMTAALSVSPSLYSSIGQSFCISTGLSQCFGCFERPLTLPHYYRFNSRP